MLEFIYSKFNFGTRLDDVIMHMAPNNDRKLIFANLLELLIYVYEQNIELKTNTYK